MVLVVVGLAVVIAPLLVFVVLIAFRDLGSPTPVTAAPAAIVGTWTNPDGAALTFSADGAVIASHLPGLAELPNNGTGTWKIEPWDADAGSGGDVAVTIGDSEGPLTTTGDPAHPAMFAYLGDPDDGDRFTFTHVDR